MYKTLVFILYPVIVFVNYDLLSDFPAMGFCRAHFIDLIILETNDHLKSTSNCG